MKKLLFLLMMVLMTGTAFGQNAVTMVNYEQNWNDLMATIALKNNTDKDIKRVQFTIEYYDMNGEMQDYKDFDETVEIAAGKTKKVDIEAYEHRREYAYEKSEYANADRRYKMKFVFKKCENVGDNRTGKEVVSPNDEEIKTNMDTSGKVYDVVEKMPSFPGGNGSLMEYLSKTVKYPIEAQDKKIQGIVVVSFVVEPDGSIKDEKVSRSVAPVLDKEALRVVRCMPRWVPGQQEGKYVRVKYSVPLSFRLQ